MIKTNSTSCSLVAVAAMLAATGCDVDNFFEVENPNIVEAATVDPVRDAAVFTQSALQNFATAYDEIAVYTAWFTSEGYVGDTFPTRNDFGRRDVPNTNGDLNGNLWFPLGRALSSSENAVDLLEPTAGAATDVNFARALMSAGYSYLTMAEVFCEGVVRGGPRQSTQQLLDAAVARFTRAIEVGTAVGGTQGNAFANAARVGRARAHLMAGRRTEAAADAQAVPANFVYNLTYVDDASSRARLGNSVFFYSAGGARESLVVPPAYRAMATAGDTRISFADAGRNAQDATLRLFSQRKYTSYAAPLRLASKLEADYIVAEATRTPATMLALINARRAVGAQGAYTGPQTEQALLAELYAQRSRDFWLEGKRMGDLRRNPALVPNLLQPGDNYYKPEVGQVGNQTCLPITFAEENANTNL